MTYTTVFSKPLLPRLRQGEVLSDIPEIVTNPGTVELARATRSFGIVVTPDCDLERDWTSRSQGQASDLRSIAFLVGIDARDRNVISKSVWGKAKKNDFAAAHTVESCAADCDALAKGLPPIYFFFKSHFTLPATFVYGQIDAGDVKRRTQLMSPYRDHLQQRFCAYLSRVALEVDHQFEE